MSNGGEPVGLLEDTTRSVVSMIADSLSEHGRHAADLASRASDPAATIDPVKELSIFSKRAMRDGAQICQAVWAMLEVLSRTPTPIDGPISQPAPTKNPCARTIGPLATSGPYQVEGLRRRGETAITIPAADVTLTKNAKDPAMLDLAIAAGAAPRGLYEGEVKEGVGAASVPYHFNIYIDWPATA